ncbi:MAG: class I SAM-dependent methyltransferase [Brevinematales bacterium]|nr:class I SAM-dependent methyltransferase [Brevinematales bacterium]
MNCHICESTKVKKLTTNLYKCEDCKTLQRSSPYEYYEEVKNLYNSTYYTQNYKNRYGKEIYEDIENVRKISNRRLDIIENLYLREGECNNCGTSNCSGCYVRNFVSSLKGKSLLDIGCGIGIFIEVAKYRGYQVKGIDINKDTLHIVPNNIRDNIFIIDINKFESKERFDIITLWYVIEHLPNPEDVIRKVWKMLKYGGILGISTPNGDGASARFKPDWYYSVIPQDHLFEFSPYSMSHLLSKNKFKVLKVVNTGYHPERIFKNPISRKIFEIYQTYIGLGDTFEIYASKKI